MDNDVIDQIKSNKTKMRPRSYFIFRAVLLIVIAVIVFLLLLFFVSFIIFVLRQDGGLLAVNYGVSGWDVFFHALPWSLLLLSLALILTLALLLKRYAFIYHQPFLYSLLALIIVVSLGSVFVAATSLHPGIMSYATRNGLPLIQGVYQFEMAPPGNIYRGEVIQMIPSGFILEEADGETSTIIIASNTPFAAADFPVGDYVVIFGHPASTATIEVFGMQRADAY
jgi:hypothetical protein